VLESAQARCEAREGFGTAGEDCAEARLAVAVAVAVAVAGAVAVAVAVAVAA